MPLQRGKAEGRPSRKSDIYSETGGQTEATGKRGKMEQVFQAVGKMRGKASRMECGMV